jgi:hypothetical protein
MVGLRTHIKKLNIQKLIGPAIITLLVAGVGVRYLTGSHAATDPYAFANASDGSLTPTASTVTDTTAFNGAFVQFGPNSTTTTTSAFVVACGLQFCINGVPYTIHGATAYGTYGQPAAEIALAKQAKVNTLELVEFESQFHTLSSTESAATWDQVDSFIAAAQAANMHVILNISGYGQSLQAAGENFTTTDWNSYLSFIANRVNTVTGVQYKNDPTIAMVELFGEVPSPNGDGGGCNCTEAQMTTFFQRTLAEWKALAPNILVSTGGFSYLNDSNSGIDWQTIVNNPDNASCDMEINSTQDETITTPMFTSYCKSIDKPWFLSAFSSCYQPNGQTYPFLTTNDAQMASHAQDMYNIAAGDSPATYPAIGADFWNLQDSAISAGTCSISPNFPLTFGVIQSNAPN